MATVIHLIAMLLFYSIVLPVSAQEPLWKDGFEAQLPGQAPAGWKLNWGKIPDGDLLTISNMECLDGRRSLLFERTAADGDVQYGVSCLTSPLTASRVKLTLPFLARGAGNQTFFSFELRSSDRNSRLAVLSAGGRTGGKVLLKSGDFKDSATLGLLVFGAWQRFVVWLPANPENDGELQAALETRQADGSWAASPRVGVKLTNRLRADRQLCIMLCPGQRGPAQLFVDALSVEAVAE